MWRTSSRRAGTLSTFFSRLFSSPRSQASTQPEPLGLEDAHATELVVPEVVAGLREAVAAAQICQSQARLGFVREANDLFFRKSLLHVQSPGPRDWTASSVATRIPGDVALAHARVAHGEQTALLQLSEDVGGFERQRSRRAVGVCTAWVSIAVSVLFG